MKVVFGQEITYSLDMKKVYLTILFSISIIFSNAEDILTIGRGDGIWKPFEWEENGELNGIHIDIIKEAAKRANITLDIVSAPFIRSLINLKNGNSDALLFVAKNNEREEYSIFDSRNIISEVRFSFVFKKSSTFEFSGNYHSLRKYNIGVVRGFVYGKSFQLNRENLNLITAKDNETLMKLLQSDRIDAMIVNVDSFKYTYAKGMDKIALDFSKPYFDITPIYIAFNRNNIDREIFEKFSNAMLEVRNSNIYNKILKKYY